MLIRLGEVQELLVRLGRLKSALRKEPRPEEPLNVTKNGRTVATLRCTVGGATDLVGFLEQGLQPVEALVASLRAVCGYFYPTENLRFTEELGYYRQREWRIVGNVAHLGESLMHPVSEDDVRFLCAIDAEFFGRRREFPMGTFKVAEQCQWFNGVEGQTIGQSLRRIIVPKSDLLGAEKLVASRNLTTAVVPLESIGS